MKKIIENRSRVSKNWIRIFILLAKILKTTVVQLHFLEAIDLDFNLISIFTKSSRFVKLNIY